MSASLATVELEKASAIIAGVRTLEEAVDLSAQAGALHELAHRKDVAASTYADTWEILQRTLRRIGELTREMPKASGGRPRRDDAETSPDAGPVSKKEALAAVGLSKQRASEYEKLAGLSEEEFKQRIDSWKAKLTKSATDASGITAPTAASDHDGDTWGTPGDIVDIARVVLGDRIELDPATNPRAQQTVKAERFYTKDNNGLSQPWKADTLWLNPPYSHPLVDQFSNRFFDAYAEGQFGAGMMLVNNATETAWFQRAMREAVVTLFLSRRVAFIGADGQPIKGNTRGQTLFYVGPHRPRFLRAFADLGAPMQLAVDTKGRRS